MQMDQFQIQWAVITSNGYDHLDTFATYAEAEEYCKTWTKNIEPEIDEVFIMPDLELPTY